MHNIDITLFNPEIPQNTGNIVRTCKATNTPLNLVKPLGFEFNDRKLKRAGLDYWADVSIKLSTIDEFEQQIETSTKPVYIFTSKTKNSFWDVDYCEGATLIFGSESKGLPEKYYSRWESKLVTIPMFGDARCLNLSNAVAIALYEALRNSRKTLVAKL